MSAGGWRKGGETEARGGETHRDGVWGGAMAVPAPNGTASPGRIMHCTVVYPLELYPAFFGYYFFNFMMAVLQSLHIFWAYLIIRMAQKFITGKARWGGGRAWGRRGSASAAVEVAGGGWGLRWRPPNPAAGQHVASRVLRSPWWGGNAVVVMGETEAQRENGGGH